RRIIKQCREPLEGRPFEPRRRDDEIVMLVLHRNKAKAILTRHAFDRDAPARSFLSYRDGNGIVRFWLRPITGRLGTSEQMVCENAGTAAGVAVDHQAFGYGRGHCENVFD